MNVPKSQYVKYYLLGFTDAEGCFSISLKKEDTARFGWALDPLFQITQHKQNKEILDVFQQELKCGRIIEKPGQLDCMLYLVDNRRQLVEKIIPFFEKHRLLCKNKDFEKFKEVIVGLENKMHHQKESFIELIKKCYEMNLEGKQRRYKLQEVIEDIEKRNPQRL
jgi:LAGLIDADG endonuclease